MRRMLRTALGAVALTVLGSTAASAQSQAPPVPSNAYIVYNGLDWAWISPCDPGGCSNFVFVDGFRYATPTEWAGRPSASAFLTPTGNFAGAGGLMACASAWFDLSYNHCDYGDPAGGYLYGGPGNGNPGNYYDEVWAVRGAQSVTPEPVSMVLLGTGLSSIGAIRRRRKNKQIEA